MEFCPKCKSAMMPVNKVYKCKDGLFKFVG